MAEDNRAINELMKLYSQVWLGLGKRQRVEERERSKSGPLSPNATVVSERVPSHLTCGLLKDIKRGFTSLRENIHSSKK